MKYTILKEVEIEVATLLMRLPVYYGVEDIPNDTPGRNGGVLELEVNVDTGRIIGWPQGRELNVYMKVVDGGIYILYDTKGEELARVEQYYVPHGLVPGENGDYVDLKINGWGVITNWPNASDIELEEFFNKEE